MSTAKDEALLERVIDKLGPVSLTDPKLTRVQVAFVLGVRGEPSLMQLVMAKGLSWNTNGHHVITSWGPDEHMIGYIGSFNTRTEISGLVTTLLFGQPRYPRDPEGDRRLAMALVRRLERLS